MSRALLNHRVQELRNLHGQEWILATDGSFDSKTSDPAGWGLFVLSPSGICWLFSGSTEIGEDKEGWHGEEDHTNNTGEMKAMLAAHVFIQHLQNIAGWPQARHEASVQRLRDAQNVTIPGQEWLDSLPNLRKQEPYDFILRALIERLINPGQRTISIAELGALRCGANFVFILRDHNWKQKVAEVCEGWCTKQQEKDEGSAHPWACSKRGAAFGCVISLLNKAAIADTHSAARISEMNPGWTKWDFRKWPNANLPFGTV